MKWQSKLLAFFAQEQFVLYLNQLNCSKILFDALADAKLFHTFAGNAQTMCCLAPDK